MVIVKIRFGQRVYWTGVGTEFTANKQAAAVLPANDNDAVRIAEVLGGKVGRV